MSFTDQKPRAATEADLIASWSGGAKGKYFRCKLCGYRFQLGDYWRWVFVRGYTNITVCQSCDTPDAEEKWVKANEDWARMKESSPFWWFISQLEARLHSSEGDVNQLGRELGLLEKDVRQLSNK